MLIVWKRCVQSLRKNLGRSLQMSKRKRRNKPKSIGNCGAVVLTKSWETIDSDQVVFTLETHRPFISNRSSTCSNIIMFLQVFEI